MATIEKVIPLPAASPPEKSKRKPRNMTSDGRRCVRVDAGYDPDTGKRIRKAFYGKTLKEAQAKADEFRHSIADGVDMAAREQPVSQWVETWLSVYGRKGAPGTVRIHERCAYHLSDALGKLKLVDVRSVHLQKYADSMAHLTRGTVNYYRITAQQIFRSAVINRIITFDPTAGVSWPGQDNGTHRMLNRGEVAVLTAHWPEHPMGALAMFMLYAGLRRGEVLALRWDDIDLTAGFIHVRHALQVQDDGNVFNISAPKTKSSVRDIPILPMLRTVIAGLPRTDPLLFPGFATRSIFQHSFDTYVTAMQQYLSGFTFRAHDLRHTFASLCYEAGVDIKTTQALLGHASTKTTMEIYTHLSSEMKATSIQALADFTNSAFGHQMGIKWPENH